MSDKLMPRQAHEELSSEARKVYSPPLVIRLDLASTAEGAGAPFDGAYASTSNPGP